MQQWGSVPGYVVSCPNGGTCAECVPHKKYRLVNRKSAFADSEMESRIKVVRECAGRFPTQAREKVWHTAGSRFYALPQPWNRGYYALHALAYPAVLFLAGIFAERLKSSKEYE